MINYITHCRGGSESDFGLAIGSKVKIVKSACIRLSNPNKDAEAGLKGFDLEFFPDDPNQYVKHLVSYLV